MALDYVGAALLTIGVIALLRPLGVIKRARAVIVTSRETFAMLSDPKVSDDDKERAARSTSGRLFAQFFFIALGAGAAIAAPTAAIWALDMLGVMSLGGVARATMSWPFLVAVLAAAAILLGLARARSS